MLVTYPSAFLFMKCNYIDTTNKIYGWSDSPCSVRNVSKLMREVIFTHKTAVGLAAPQVGFNIQLMLVLDKTQWLWMINPTIIEQSGKYISQESCLSLVDEQGNMLSYEVERPRYICIKAYDLAGNLRTHKGEGFIAAVMSHEYDHLQGTLVKDKGKLVTVKEEH